MGIPEWNEVVRICNKLGFDPDPYQLVFNYGKLIYDLTMMEIGAIDRITPDIKNYMPGGKYGN